jgi:hypothetical protein
MCRQDLERASNSIALRACFCYFAANVHPDADFREGHHGLLQHVRNADPGRFYDLCCLRKSRFRRPICRDRGFISGNDR